jgi:hypothetical protein
MSLFSSENTESFEETMLKNYNIFLEYINSDTRSELLHKMYKDFEEQLITAPASAVLHFHNAFPGGYLDHIIRVTNLALKVAALYRDAGGNIGFTKQELIFSALHHDLGKLGDPSEGPYYIDQDSDWHRKQGKYYSQNENIQYFKVPDRSLYLLQKYGIVLTQNEWLGIKLSDGIYDEATKSYLTHSGRYPMKTSLPYIIHWADHMASRAECDKNKII